jgi:hypothetical protein
MVELRAAEGDRRNVDRCIAEVFASGENIQLTAKRFEVSTGRMSQLRRKLHMAWLRFQGEVVSVPQLATACG